MRRRSSTWLILGLVPLLLGCAALEGLSAAIARAVRMAIEAIALTLALAGGAGAVAGLRRKTPVRTVEIVVAALVAVAGVAFGVAITEQLTFHADGPTWLVRVTFTSAMSAAWLVVALGRRSSAVRRELALIPLLAWLGYLGLITLRVLDPVPAPPTLAIRELRANAQGEACGRLEDGSIACWGRSVQAQRVTIDGVKELLRSGDLTCGITDDARLRCWAADGPTITVYDVAADIVAAAGHLRRLCGATLRGDVVCWEHDRETGDPPAKGQPAPVSHRFSEAEPVLGLSGLPRSNAVVELGLGDHHGCARREDGTIWCWGRPAAALGPRAEEAPRGAPAKVQGLQPTTQLACGADFCCAREEAGTLVCWGTDEAGQRGDGDAVRAKGELTRVTGISDAVELGAGYWHACARLEGGEVRCWGGNGWGQIGDAQYAGEGSEKRPTNMSFPTPREIALPSPATDLQVSRAATCLRSEDEVLRCWGKFAHAALRGEGKGKTQCDGGLLQPTIWCSDEPQAVQPLVLRPLTLP